MAQTIQRRNGAKAPYLDALAPLRLSWAKACPDEVPAWRHSGNLS